VDSSVWINHPASDKLKFRCLHASNFIAQEPLMTSRQFPIHSGFGAQATAREVLDGVDLHGKIAIVTGGYSGLGLETTRVLADAGATVIVPARTPGKARNALAGIPRTELAALDLLNPASITAFAQGFIESGRPLHMLVNSAGIMAPPLVRDARGYESQFSANHLGHFQLASHLLPALRKANGARVVSVSSRGHQFGGVDFDDPHFVLREYDRWKAYGQSKTANALFALELDARGAEHGIRAFSAHPGRIMDTGLVRHLSFEDLRASGAIDEHGKVISNIHSKSIEQGLPPWSGAQRARNWTAWAACIAKTPTSQRRLPPISPAVLASSPGPPIRSMPSVCGC
jgi:NAD(P)-dependent dehydrogenase (short-subunit alcohol dehydrogenase family)